MILRYSLCSMSTIFLLIGKKPKSRKILDIRLHKILKCKTRKEKKEEEEKSDEYIRASIGELFRRRRCRAGDLLQPPRDRPGHRGKVQELISRGQALHRDVHMNFI